MSAAAESSAGSARIQLVPHAPAQLLALIESEAAYAASFGISPAPGLRDFFTGGDVEPSYLEALRSATSADPWTHGFAVVHLDRRLAIGLASFKGPPVLGAVEIAYAIAPDFQGHGFATEAAGALVRYASKQPDVHRIVAHTLPETNASTRVLQKCGFRHAGKIIEPGFGPVWQWELHPVDGARQRR